VSNRAQKQAIKNYRRRLRKQGLARFEVLGRHTDRALIRSLAKKLAQDDPEANRLRAEVTRSVSGSAGKGGILAALRRSPLVGSDLNTLRPVESGREIDL
jgi:transposase